MMKKNNYLKILRRTDKSKDYWQAALSCQSFSNNINDENLMVLFNTSTTAVGPILLSYVLWVLKEAKKNKVHTLYFLARDGYVMYKIAQQLCLAFNIDTELKYLYISRIALRSSLYCVDPNETIDMICKDGINISPLTALKRTGLTENICKVFLNSFGYNVEDYNIPLTKSGLQYLKEKLLLCRKFDEVMSSFSHEKCLLAQQYFEQEGLYSSSSWAIVDSGWTGSIQRTLMKILQYQKATPIMLTGYYFGIQNPTSVTDGIYHSFYFDHTSHNIYRYILFNNNLFECWCSATHGMTLGYEMQNDHVQPLLKSYTPIWYESSQVEYILQYVDSFIKTTKSKNYSIHNIPLLNVEPLIRMAMTAPSRAEASVYGVIPFCDDSTEAYYLHLAGKMELTDLIYGSTLGRILSKLLSKGAKRTYLESCWKEGSYALQSPPLSWFMRLDCKIFYMLKILYYYAKPKK